MTLANNADSNPNCTSMSSTANAIPAIAANSRNFSFFSCNHASGIFRFMPDLERKITRLLTAVEQPYREHRTQRPDDEHRQRLACTPSPTVRRFYSSPTPDQTGSFRNFNADPRLRDFEDAPAPRPFGGSSGSG